MEVVTVSLDVKSMKEKEEKYWREEGEVGEATVMECLLCARARVQWQNCRSETVAGH